MVMIRFATVLIYLSDVEEGGETCFPEGVRTGWPVTEAKAKADVRASSDRQRGGEGGAESRGQREGEREGCWSVGKWWEGPWVCRLTASSCA